MPFPLTYLLDQPAPSETFIRRELEQLKRRSWPVFTRFLKGGPDPLKYAVRSCPEGFRWRFLKAVSRRIIEELPHAPTVAARILKRLPQAAYLVKKTSDADCRLLHAQFAGLTADLVAIAARTLGLPWTCAVHAQDVFTAQPGVLYRRLRTAARTVACSQQAADSVIAAGIPKENVVVIRHGLPLNDFAFDTIQPDGLVLFAGRLEPKKGVDTLLRACSLLLKRGLHFTCVIAGDGPSLNDLKHLSKKLELTDTVVFIGWQSQEETRSRIMDASVLVLPSRRLGNGDRDGIANVLVEAMALGTPVLTTTASAAPEVIADQVNGLLVPPDDPAKLAEALATALTSKELLLRLAKAGRLTVESHFDGSKNIETLEAFFKQAVMPPS